LQEEVKISIIIPVYNVEKYLHECLDSIINQTFTDIEIICVDDGSTDKSSEILEEYEQKDKRFTVISQPNKGVSAARNRGMQQAKGKYIMFVDSDDYIASNACELIYNSAEEKRCDILLFPHYNFSASTCRDDGRLLDLYITLKDNTTTFKEYSDEFLLTPSETHSKLYKTDFLRKYNLHWETQIQYCEDRIFYINALIHAKAISILYKHLYYYRIDTFNSLSKNNHTILPHLYKVHIALKKILLESKVENSDILCVKILNCTIRSYLAQWGRIHNIPVQSKNIKYLYKIAKECKKIPKEYREYLSDYDRLQQSISNYRMFYIKKLFEPIFEIESRRNRIVIYLFEKQAINFSTHTIINLLLNIRYFKHLCKLRLCANYRKIRVGFWVTEIQKWSSQASLYEALKKSSHFEPFVLLANFKKSEIGISPQEHIRKGIKFFESRGIELKLVYDINQYRHLELKTFKPDIVFYQQPWQIPDKQNLINTSKYALIAYVPYCYHSQNSYVNYLLGFHGKLWKYFVETELHKKEYEQIYKAKNCIAVGSCKLDNYKLIDSSKINKIWKTTGKKRIIYAPHHFFEQEAPQGVSTFDKNGNFILRLAKSHPEYEWIFRPHPVFKDRVLRYKIKTLSEIEAYFAEWEQLGTVYSGGDYYEMFAGSDCLITDCISFLSEYLPTGKPVIHLRKDKYIEEFNDLLNVITDSYYKVYNNDMLLSVFNDVIVNNNDYLRNERIKNISLLNIIQNKTTGEKITEYLEKELWQRG